MKTTLKIDDSVMERLNREAARQGRTMSELVESALRLLFPMRRKRPDLPPLPTDLATGAARDLGALACDPRYQTVRVVPRSKTRMNASISMRGQPRNHPMYEGDLGAHRQVRHPCLSKRRVELAGRWMEDRWAPLRRARVGATH